ncbi:MAG: hypothetical protein NWQ09_05045, partial [Nonlabens sp.]|nr:hypothetical protein [Nonlabens sp.]
SFIAMLGFYSVLALLFKIRKNSLAMVCIVCLMVLIAGSDLFTLLSYPVNFGTSTASVILGVSLMFLIGVVYVLLGVAIYRQREIYGDFEKWLGIIAVISGIGYAVIILFPVGIVGELVFEILLVSLFFKLYEQHKKA